MKYNISKGEYSPSGIHLGLHTGRVNQTYKVRFDSSCLYDDTVDWERDWNKLVGWSLSNTPFFEEGKYKSPHHRDSVRFVWRSNFKNQTIEIAFYYYQDKTRTIIPLAELKADTEYILGIFLRGSDVTLTVVEKGDSDDPLFLVKTHVMKHPFKAICSYKLYPYFGGTNPAYNTMSLEVTEL